MTSSMQTPTWQLEKVKQLNGQELEVMGADEKRYYTSQQRKYVQENKFTLASDLSDLDRLLFLELLMFRWTKWMSSGRDHDRNLLTDKEEEQIRKNLKETAPLISVIKNDLGLTKSQRDKESAESPGAYLAELKKRAKEHGIRREKQLTTGIALCKELFSLLGTYDRSNQLERSKIGLEDPDAILDWIRGHMRPEFDKVDAHFRQNSQKFWVGTL